MEKLCNTCRQSLPLEDFPRRKTSKDGRGYRCKKCTREESQKYYEENKEKIIGLTRHRSEKYRERNRKAVFDYLKEHPCEVCGESDPIVLEFHHLRDKESEVSYFVSNSNSVSKILEEVAKCQVLCANCHRRKTAQQRGWHALKY